jgi:hypothetical protein
MVVGWELGWELGWEWCRRRRTAVGDLRRRGGLELLAAHLSAERGHAPLLRERLHVADGLWGRAIVPSVVHGLTAHDPSERVRGDVLGAACQLGHLHRALPLYSAQLRVQVHARLCGCAGDER